MTKKKNSIDLLLSAMPKNTKTVEIENIAVEIEPLSLMTISKLLRRFPEALKLLFGESDKPEQLLINQGPEMIAAIISASMGFLNDIENEQKISQLPDEWQGEILGEVIQATMPDGLDAFLGKLAPFLGKMGITTEAVADDS